MEGKDLDYKKEAEKIIRIFVGPNSLDWTKREFLERQKEIQLEQKNSSYYEFQEDERKLTNEIIKLLENKGR